MSTSPASGEMQRASGIAQLRYAVRLLVLGFLAYLALRFFVRDPLHYILDHSEQSFGRHWQHRWLMLLHIAGGTLALFAGPFQLWTGLGRRYLHLHRWTGRVYLAGTLVGGAAAFYLAFSSPLRDFGIALFMMALAWWTTVAMATLAILRQQVAAHKEWMIRGYVVAFAFVTFRWWLEFPVWEFLGSARLATVAWLSWVVPLLVAEVLLQWKRTVGLARSVA